LIPHRINARAEPAVSRSEAVEELKVYRRPFASATILNLPEAGKPKAKTYEPQKQKPKPRRHTPPQQKKAEKFYE